MVEVARTISVDKNVLDAINYHSDVLKDRPDDITEIQLGIPRLFLSVSSNPTALGLANAIDLDFIAHSRSNTQEDGPHCFAASYENPIREQFNWENALVLT